MLGILWNGDKPSLLVSGTKKKFWVENGAWELDLDIKTLQGKVIKTKQKISFDYFTTIPVLPKDTKLDDYNFILSKAEEIGHRNLTKIE